MTIGARKKIMTLNVMRLRTKFLAAYLFMGNSYCSRHLVQSHFFRKMTVGARISLPKTRYFRV